MEIIEREGKFFIFHAEEIPQEIAAMMQENNILHSLDILRREKPEIFGFFLDYLQEFIGYEEMIPADWEAVKADFSAYFQAVIESII